MMLERDALGFCAVSSQLDVLCCSRRMQWGVSRTESHHPHKSSDDCPIVAEENLVILMEYLRGSPELSKFDEMIAGNLAAIAFKVHSADQTMHSVFTTEQVI